MLVLESLSRVMRLFYHFLYKFLDLLVNFQKGYVHSYFVVSRGYWSRHCWRCCCLCTALLATALNIKTPHLVQTNRIPFFGQVVFAFASLAFIPCQTCGSYEMQTKPDANKPGNSHAIQSTVADTHTGTEISEKVVKDMHVSP